RGGGLARDFPVVLRAQQNRRETEFARQGLGALGDLRGKPLLALPARAGEKRREFAAHRRQMRSRGGALRRGQVEIPARRAALDAQGLGELSVVLAFRDRAAPAADQAALQMALQVEYQIEFPPAHRGEKTEERAAPARPVENQNLVDG